MFYKQRETSGDLRTKGQVSGYDSLPSRKLIGGMLYIAMHTSRYSCYHKYDCKTSGECINEAPKDCPESYEISE